MRFLAVVVMALLAVPAAFGQDEHGKLCDQVDSLAQTIMERRQNGMPARDMYDAMGADGNDIAAQMIDEAYDKPRYQTDDMKEQTVQEFRNRWFQICRRQMSG